MADNPFGTPVSQLALEMAVRNQQTLEDIPRMTANQRELLNRRLTRYGGDISQYQDVMDVGYDPTVNAMRSSLTGMRDYLVGLPEVLQKAMKEGETSGVTYKAPPNTNPLQDYLNRQLKAIEYAQNFTISPAQRPSPDVIDRPQTTPRLGVPSTGSRVTAQTSRRPTGSYFGGYRR